MAETSITRPPGYIITRPDGLAYMGRDLEGHWWGPRDHAGVYPDQRAADRAASLVARQQADLPPLSTEFVNG